MANSPKEGMELYAKKKLRWGSVAYFAALFLVAAVGIPIYAAGAGIKTADWVLFWVYSFLTILSITAGYHRLYSHRAFEAHRWIEAALLFFGAAAAQQSALKWSALHRQHHRFVDTDQDPYNIQRGFFHAHMGWLLFWKYRVDYDQVRDLQTNKLLMHQHNHFQSWVIVAGLILPVLIGIAYGSWIGGLLFGVAARLTLVYQATFCINSVAHTLGSRRYDAGISARDHWFCSILTNGEGYHNFHHRFPSDYRNGVRWYDWDPSKWVIALWERLGLARGLRRTPPETIAAARVDARNRNK